MIWFFVGLIFIIFCFSFVMLFGAPYLPTLSPQIEAAFKLLDLKKNNTILELGSGDGKVLIAAAKQGYNAIGFELNPILFLLSYVRTMRYRKKVKLHLGNFWRVALPEADGIFVFLIDKKMETLDKKLKLYKYKPLKVASFAFKIPNKKIIKTLKGVNLYEYR